jgi:hypothetical protein
MCRIDEDPVIAHTHRPPGDGKNIYVLGARRIAEQSVASGDDDDVRLEHRDYGTHSRGGVRVGEYAIGRGTSLARPMLT